MAENSPGLIGKVRDALAEEIRSGVLASGSKLPGERKLAERFGTSRGTILEAMNLLESQNLIERLPRSGSYVAPPHRRFAIAFPGDNLPFEKAYTVENWGIVTEVFRGVLAEAAATDSEAILLYFKMTEDPVELNRQLRRLSGFDAAVFLDSNQLDPLRKLLREQRIPFSKMTGGPDSRDVLAEPDIVGNFAVLCRETFRRGYRRVSVIGNFSDQGEWKKKFGLFESAAKKTGLAVFDVVPDVNPERLRSLKAGTDAVYCANSDLIPEFYRVCRECGLVPGRDFGLFAYASGITFANLYPALSYLNIGHVELGRMCCRGLMNILNGKRSEHILVHGELIKGETL